MGDLSVKGVLRKHLGVTGDFWLKSALFPVPLPVMSVRAVLESVARTEHEYRREDAFVSRWKARYEQTWTHICVGIELKPNNNDAEDALDDGLKDTWKSSIEEIWSNRYWARANGELACRLSFEVVWVDQDAHHDVHVKYVGPGEPEPRSSMTHWHTTDPGSTAAHEYGHLIGKFDEYEDPDFPGRELVKTGTVMDCHSQLEDNDLVTQDCPLVPFSPRLFSRFAQDLGCFVCDRYGIMIPKPY